jgi:hypothetical protein
MSRIKLMVGDVFAVPIDENRVGVGQIVGKYGNSAYYFAIFDVVAPDGRSIDLDKSVLGRILFLALSLDAKLFVGDWTVLGRRPVRAGMPLPAFKESVGVGDQIYVVDYSGERRRPAVGIESTMLCNRKVVAPVRLEKALRAKYGLEPWVAAYTDLAPEETNTTARFFRD